MNNLDMNNLIAMLSKMDKKDLEKGLAQASQILSSGNKEDILKNLKNNNSNK